MSRPFTEIEYMELHGKLQTQFMRHGHSRSKAYTMADDFLFQKTGQSLHGSVWSSDSNLNAAAGYRTPRSHTKEFVRETKPQRGYDRMFQEGTNFQSGLSRSSRPEHVGRNAGSTKSYGQSSHVYTTEELEAIEKDIYETWVKRGAYPDHARQQAKMWFNRYAGKSVRSGGAPGPSRSDRPLTSDDLGRMNDASKGKDGYCGRASGPSHSSFTHGPRDAQPRPPGWEYPTFNQYSTSKPAFTYNISQGYPYYKENEDSMPRLYINHERFGPKEAHRGFSSLFNSYNSTYDDNKPPRHSYCGESPGHSTKKRHPSGFYSYRFTYGPKDSFSGYDDCSYWDTRNDCGYGPRFSSGWPPIESSGVKPLEDLYVTLHILPSASAEDIKQAHRKLSLMYHPDRERGGPAAKKAATERMARINQAYDLLKDDEMRAFYDRTGLVASRA